LAVLGSLTITRVVVPPLLVILTDDVGQKVWLSLSNYHGGAYPQDSLSFLVSRGKRTNFSWAYIYMVAAMTESLMWPSESVNSLCRDGADAQYMQYLSKSRITSPQVC